MLSESTIIASAVEQGCRVLNTVAVLFARHDSVYKTLPGCDVFDAARDARNYQGPHPIVAHPPCRSWGCLRMMCKASEEEKALGPWTVEQVRKWGGVLEHPRGSTLWRATGLPRPGLCQDLHGGFTLSVDQHWWGHRAQKTTWLYVCGLDRANVPEMPLHFGYAPNVVTNIHGLRAGMPGYRKEITKRERDATPERFAYWLVELARRCPSSKSCSAHVEHLPWKNPTDHQQKPERKPPQSAPYCCCSHP